MDEPLTATGRRVVSLPEDADARAMGPLPSNIVIVPQPVGGRRLPDLRRIELLVPPDRPAERERVLAVLDAMPRLRVLQTLSAGVDWLRGRVPEAVQVCNARGVYDAPLAEWVVGAILAMERGLVRSRDAQAAATWRSFEPSEIAGRRVVILGHGSIGSAVAARLAPFGVDLVGVTRSGRAGTLGFEDLDDALRGADILVDLLPLTSETTGFLDARRLALLPEGSLLINAGRGRTVDTPSLVAAAEGGRLRAVLDVTDPEPLPPDHPLWRLPDVLITPHIAGDSAGATARGFALVGDQLRRFAAGEPLLNEVPRYLLD